MKILLVVSLAFVLAGCGSVPILPALGERYGADRVECHYSRDGGNYKSWCVIVDQGEV